MASLTATENAPLERAADAPMLAQVERWVAVNSGTRNLDGLATMAGLLADAFAVLPGFDMAAAAQALDGGPDVETVRTVWRRR